MVTELGSQFSGRHRNKMSRLISGKVRTVSPTTPFLFTF